jgi:hypothetical protein
MRKTICALMLALALSASTYAGDMQCGVTDTPPPPPSASEQSSVETDGSVMPNGEPDTTSQTALTIIGSLLTLF